jgi:hypothetical protein
MLVQRRWCVRWCVRVERRARGALLALLVRERRTSKASTSTNVLALLVRERRTSKASTSTKSTCFTSARRAACPRKYVCTSKASKTRSTCRNTHAGSKTVWGGLQACPRRALF